MASRRYAVLAAVLATAIVLSGCIGAKSRDEFEAIVQARGGGVSASIFDAVCDDSVATPIARRTWQSAHLEGVTSVASQLRPDHSS